MIKLVYCISRKHDLSEEEFFRYWKEIHAAIGARIPGLKQLVQSHTIRVPGDAYEPGFDGMAELWFDSLEMLAEARKSPEWKASTADEANFIDPNRVAYFVSKEHQIPVPGI